MKNKRHVLIFCFKLIISLLILYLLISHIGINPILKVARNANHGLFTVVLLMHFVIMFVSALRTEQLVQFPIRMKRLFSISAISYFFNTFTPANLGGEIVKIYLLKKEFQNAGHNQITYAATPVIIEKFIGLFITLLLCIMFLPFLINYIYEIQNLWLFPLIIFIFFFLSWIFLRFKIGSKIKIISAFHDSLIYFRTRKKNIFCALIYTFAIQILNIIMICILSYSLGLRIDNLFYFSIMPLVALINLVPISVGGLGIREGAFIFFLKAINISPDMAITLSLLSYLATALASMFGLIEYLRYRHIIIDENL